MQAGQAGLGTFLSFVAAVLLVFVSVSSPTWERISFLDVSSGITIVHFGVFGYTGSKLSIGYHFDPSSIGFNPSHLESTIILNLTKALILHLIAAGLSGIAFLLGLRGMGYHRFGAILMTLVSGLAAITTLVVWVIDMSLFGVVRYQFRNQGIPAQYGNANWLTLGALGALLLGFITSTKAITTPLLGIERVLPWRNAPTYLTYLDPGQPKFHRGLLWTLNEVGHSPTALSTLHDPPLPQPASHEFRPEILSTISAHADLFRIVTPIKIDVFASYLRKHPNKPFVQSVLRGLREGFWPFADTHPGIYPLTHDASLRPPKARVQRQFLIDQCQEEVSLGRYSQPFGTQLYPGMYSMPIHSVPKPNSSKLRLIVDHSASKFSLNSMISRDDIAGARLDSIKDLADSLIQFRRDHGNVPLVVFKSDVSAAYRQLPMHPLWQIKQVITVEDQRHVDRCNSFGNRASQRIWVAFMGLVHWIAINVILLEHLKLYTDDTFSFERASARTLYLPYKVYMPTKQARLLQLWDKLGIPHERRKQLWGPTLTIIGFLVDPNAMTVTMPPEKRDDLLSAIVSFCSPANQRHQQPLRSFMQMAGWMNWALNVYPFLKPGLRAIYEKIRTETKPDALIPISTTMRFELSWFANHMRDLPGILIMESLAWQPQEADHTFFCDASLSGLGCYFPATSSCFQVVPPLSAPKKDILFLEALCICWAIHIAHRRTLRGRVLIFTHNKNAVAMFQHLHTQLDAHNPILMSAVDILLLKDFSVQVVSVSSSKNVIANALSRGQHEPLLALHPNLVLHPTEPLPVLPSPPRATNGWLSS